MHFIGWNFGELHYKIGYRRKVAASRHLTKARRDVSLFKNSMPPQFLANIVQRSSMNEVSSDKKSVF